MIRNRIAFRSQGTEKYLRCWGRKEPRILSWSSKGFERLESVMQLNFSLISDWSVLGGSDQKEVRLQSRVGGRARSRAGAGHTLGLRT